MNWRDRIKKARQAAETARVLLDDGALFSAAERFDEAASQLRQAHSERGTLMVAEVRGAEGGAA